MDGILSNGGDNLYILQLDSCEAAFLNEWHGNSWEYYKEEICIPIPHTATHLHKYLFSLKRNQVLQRYTCNRLYSPCMPSMGSI